MIYIAHRGNINGPALKLENHPDYIINAINKNYDCEIDVWKINDKLYLGHDEPQYLIEIDFILKYVDKLWCHCKNFEALHHLIKFDNINCFWHHEDKYTLTSKGFIWAYPGEIVNDNCIIVMPEWDKFNINDNSYGVCSDFVEKLKYR